MTFPKNSELRKCLEIWMFTFGNLEKTENYYGVNGIEKFLSPDCLTACALFQMS